MKDRVSGKACGAAITRARPNQFRLSSISSSPVAISSIWPVTAVLTGTDESEKLQGFESDDVVTGGGGPDLFPFTTGTDVITDFDPAQDMIDVGDFARPSDGFAVLTSLEAIAAHSTETTIDGVPALVIDVDGPLGDSTTTLIGVTLSDLDAGNVFFGLDDTSIPPLDFTRVATAEVTYSTGEVESVDHESHDEGDCDDE